MKYIFAFILAGLLFSGYLSAVKLFTDTCAFSESCPYFLGYPACWYGFAMYLIMFITVSLALLNKLSVITATRITLMISFLGILFAGSFFVQELLRSQVTGSLGLSTCTYGLIFYIIIFTLSLFTLKKLS